MRFSRSTTLKKLKLKISELLLAYSIIILVSQLEDCTQPFGMAIVDFIDLHILYQHRILQN
jgi:hypothetical protein